MDVLGNIVGNLNEIETIGAAIGAGFGFKALFKHGGGRVKQFTLINNMPPNRLAERCASSNVHRSGNI